MLIILTQYFQKLTWGNGIQKNDDWVEEKNLTHQKGETEYMD